MTRSYAFSRKDGNHDELATIYIQLGCSCVDLSAEGRGVPDAMVGAAGVTDLVEFKMPGEGLRPNQETFHSTWRGSPVWVIRTPADVEAHVRSMRSRARKQGGMR